jgi:hypothetical protein
MSSVPQSPRKDIPRLIVAHAARAAHAKIA